MMKKSQESPPPCSFLKELQAEWPPSLFPWWEDTVLPTVKGRKYWHLLVQETYFSSGSLQVLPGIFSLPKAHVNDFDLSSNLIPKTVLQQLSPKMPFGRLLSLWNQSKQLLVRAYVEIPSLMEILLSHLSVSSALGLLSRSSSLLGQCKG